MSETSKETSKETQKSDVQYSYWKTEGAMMRCAGEYATAGEILDFISGVIDNHGRSHIIHILRNGLVSEKIEGDMPSTMNPYRNF